MKTIRLIILVLIISTTLFSNSPSIDTYLDNYNHYIFSQTPDDQIRFTNYLLIVNCLIPLKNNDQVRKSLDRLISTSDSQSVKHHAEIVKWSLMMNKNEVIAGKNEFKGSKKQLDKTILLFLDYINRNFFKLNQ